jgi:hypothetical protein
MIIIIDAGGVLLKKILSLFAVFSCIIMILTPMVNSVETKLVEVEIEYTIDDVLLKIDRILNLYKIIENASYLKDFMRLIILLVLLFPILFIVIALTAYGRWKYMTIRDVILMYFTIIFSLIEHIIHLIFGNEIINYN